MSFKQTKHWDSELSRSLEKIAYEKGLIKPEPLKKEASKKEVDFSPTSDLMQNIIKLCNGLRYEGFEKEAIEIENNFLNYKKANTLYETSKETGDDLVESAHPEGSHHLKDIDSDEAVIEDILDKREKIKQVLDKKPTGKLSSSKEILNAVKVTLGAAPLAVRKGNLSTKKSFGQDAATQPTPTKSDSSGISGGIVGGVGTAATMLTVQKAINALTKWRVGHSINIIEKNLQFLEKVAPKSPEAMKFLFRVAPRLPFASEAPVAQTAINLAKNFPSVVQNVVPEAKIILTQSFGGGSREAAAEAAKVLEQEAAKKLSQQAVKSTVLSNAERIGLTGMRAWLANSAGPLGMSTAEAGVAGTAGAVAGGLAIGAGIGYLLAKYVFFGEIPETISNITEAGDKVISDLEFMSSDLDENDKKFKASFEANLAKVKKALPNQDKLTKNPSKEDIISLLDFSDILGASTTDARNIWGAATAHIDDQFLGTLRGFSNVKKHAQNYIDAANKIRDAIISGSQKFRAEAEQKLKEAGGGTSLITDYQSIINRFALLLNLAQHKQQMEGKDQVIEYLNSTKEYIVEESKDFNSVSPANKKELAPEYIKRLEEAKADLDAAEKYIRGSK